jgi:hypothetical protein
VRGALRLRRPSRFRNPERVFAWSVTLGDVSFSRRSELSHQQKLKAKHTISQWRRMEMSFLTW